MKLAGHVEDRLGERSTLSPSVLAEARARLKKLPQGSENTYHWTLRNEDDQVQGHLTVRRVGKARTPVLTTFLSPHMSPSGPELSSTLGRLSPVLQEKVAEGFVWGLRKEGSTRYDRALEKGEITLGELASATGLDPRDSKFREDLMQPSKPAPGDAKALTLRNKINEKRNLLHRKAEVHGVPNTTVHTGAHPLSIAATELRRDGTLQVTVPEKGMASVLLGSMQRTEPVARRLGESPAEAYVRSAQERHGKQIGVIDPTATYATLQHELGEAAEGGRAKVTPFASHLGVEPILREQLATQGDAVASKLFHKVRQQDPADAHVQKLIRQVGGTPGAPVPLDGKQHRALVRLMSDPKVAPVVGPGGRRNAHILGHDKVPYLAEGVPSQGQMKDALRGLRLSSFMSQARRADRYIKDGAVLPDKITLGDRARWMLPAAAVAAGVGLKGHQMYRQYQQYKEQEQEA